METKQNENKMWTWAKYMEPRCLRCMNTSYRQKISVNKIVFVSALNWQQNRWQLSCSCPRIILVFFFHSRPFCSDYLLLSLESNDHPSICLCHKIFAEQCFFFSSASLIDWSVIRYGELYAWQNVQNVLPLTKIP